MDEDRTEHVAAPPPLHRRSLVRELVVGCVILLCGVAIGSVATAVALRRGHDPDARGPGHGPDRIVQKMQEEYGLTDDQANRLRTVFKEHWEKLSAIRAEVQPRVDAEFDSLKRTVESILTPDQARRWREDFERRQRDWHARAVRPAPTPAEH